MDAREQGTLKTKEKEILESIKSNYSNLDDKGEIYILGIAEGMATQKQLAKEKTEETA